MKMELLQSHDLIEPMRFTKDHFEEYELSIEAICEATQKGFISIIHAKRIIRKEITMTCIYNYNCQCNIYEGGCEDNYELNKMFDAINLIKDYNSYLQNIVSSLSNIKINSKYKTLRKASLLKQFEYSMFEVVGDIEEEQIKEEKTELFKIFFNLSDYERKIMLTICGDYPRFLYDYLILKKLGYITLGENRLYWTKVKVSLVEYFGNQVPKKTKSNKKRETPYLFWEDIEEIFQENDLAQAWSTRNPEYPSDDYIELLNHPDFNPPLNKERPLIKKK